MPEISPLLHIARKTDWEAAVKAGSYEGPTLRSEGFTHCSTEEQILGVAERFFRGVRGLVLLRIDPRKLDAEIRWENLEGGKELFPHIYGAIETTAVYGVEDFEPGPDGDFTLSDR